MRQDQEIPYRSTWLLRFKTALSWMIVLTAISRIVVIVLMGHHASTATFVSLGLQVAAFATLPFVIHRNHLRERRSLSLFLVFWPLYLVALATWLRTAWATGWLESNVIELGLVSATATLGTLTWILECVGPEHERGSYHPVSKDVNESPFETANIYSRWTFSWMNGLMRLGAQRPLEEEDVYVLGAEDQADILAEKLERATENHKNLWSALAVAYGATYGEAAFLKVIQDLLAFAQPQFLRMFLAYIARFSTSGNGSIQGPSIAQGFVIVGAMFISAMTQTIVLHQYFDKCYRTGMRVRSGLVTLIYKKTLVLSNEERNKMPSGDTVNLASVDAMRLQDLCTYGLIAISGPFQITLAFVSLYNLLGWSAFVGVAVMVVAIPINTAIARYTKKLQEQQMKNTDKRTRLMSELLNNIKSIKLYAWERFFMAKVLQVRNEQELRLLRKIGVTNAVGMMFWGTIPLLVSLASFTAAAYTRSEPLTSDIVFPAISLFLLLSFPLAMFAQITTSIVSAMVSVKRLSKFLHAGELQEAAVVYEDEIRALPALEIKSGDFRWAQESAQPTLEDINLKVGSGELVAVLGRVGSGKTSLLSAIAGEMHKSEGTVTVRGSVAYCPQNPWIMSATVRDNILFCHEYEEEYYNIVLDACALRPDLALLEQGDMTEIGEKGINLSGGQRARIALARAVYARADLTLLDDVLAAVDNHVARHIFDHVIGPRGLLANKARVLVTNSVAYLAQTTNLVLMRSGIILESAPYEAIYANSQSELFKFITIPSRSETNSGRQSGTATPRTKEQTQEDIKIEKSEVQTPETLTEAEPVSKTSKAIKSDIIIAAPEADKAKREHRERGKVKMEVYKQYITAGGIGAFFLLAMITALGQAVNIGSTYILKSWAEHNRRAGRNADTNTYLALYGAAVFLSSLLSLMVGILLSVIIIIRSTKYMHDRVLQALLRCPLSFFEQTPSGRILNVFSRDVYVLDQVLARVISGALRTFSSVMGTVFVVCISFPLFTFALLPLGVFYYRVLVYYLATSRELKRLDSITRAPIFTWFQETLSGLSTIRAFRHQRLFTLNLEKRLDRNQMQYMASINVNRWLAIRLEFIGSMIILLVAVLALVKLLWFGGVDAGLVGMVLSYCLSVSGALNWMVRSASEVEQNIVSVERMIQYANLKPEAEMTIEATRPRSPWPSNGIIEFKHMSMRYRPELENVLKDINVTIPKHAKVGCVGRTGSGKSSTMLVLLRMVEPSEGTIIIDDVDITKIGLADRNPQCYQHYSTGEEPQLFEGTIRDNIDPSSSYGDQAIWSALEKSGLKEHITIIGGLDAPVNEGGSSLSAGQRQLLCFARALLRQTRIILLDEATSAVDPHTDAAIQSIITGPDFEDVTMITVAHRINTIMDYDYIMVLDAGKVIEYDTPNALLARKDSVFRSLAAEAKLVDDL
ncbi:probable YCF1-Vacuolar ABC transporter responsible for vacuolar sequestration of glutathione-S-conjugates [Serendipita indica DSM 11827]|uniref:Probable YCF1-Vacuolar ABC transporter responsible for vacuolar sequestration of glutathione-S-conjugates n=1 Tax=Serendipita indica (strain DSM 11827) TaxID=1109443 RepID=G4T5Z5_SERID|nr:probable YCF1-Vacuolar ABC transporter responsible for vacuolar sequestration of glutathione-S-conjugates [Serendipita indica DSM 11827]